LWIRIDVVGNEQEDIHGATNPDALKWKSWISWRNNIKTDTECYRNNLDALLIILGFYITIRIKYILSQEREYLFII
jgi:hypothetical protein